MTNNAQHSSSVGHIFMIGVATFCVWFFASLSVILQTPSIISPFSVPVVLPTLLVSMLGWPHWLTAILGGLPIASVFIVLTIRGSHRTRLQERVSISNASIIFITLVALVSVLMHAVLFQNGLQVQGLFHIFTIYVFNILCITTIPVLYWRHFKCPNLKNYLLFHTFFFSWLGFSAFPWLGELL
ncbi:hypothetical protein KJ365_05295 [Glaciecola sp. XM2]|uniref:hypothetical protein n=1 Tax=Glaciecola sp. XM2 TaxID=1914931 RepID=UPI001BDF0671|nr:hypothetical protein [Glaciecola sp. XM2]MBT1450288.1 hypothetical protein [Glaciecola sp. XM2]